MKKYIKSLIFIFITFIAINARVNAQTTWHLSQSVGNVDFYYSITTCNADSAVLLKFVNNNSGSVTVTWKEVFETQYGSGLPGYFGTKQMTLAPGITEQANCSSTTCAKCLITADRVNPGYMAKIYSFSFADITVN
jgi:hypothetical protein